MLESCGTEKFLSSWRDHRSQSLLPFIIRHKKKTGSANHMTKVHGTEEKYQGLYPCNVPHVVPCWICCQHWVTASEAWRLGQLSVVKRSSAKASWLMGQSSSQKPLWVQLMVFSSEFHYSSETTKLHNILAVKLKEWRKARWVLCCFFLLTKWNKCTFWSKPAFWKFTLIILNSNINNTNKRRCEFTEEVKWVRISYLSSEKKCLEFVSKIYLGV